MDEVLKLELGHMVEEQGGLGEARQLRRNLEETCVKIGEIYKYQTGKLP